MSLVSPFLTILVLNVNRLRSPIQRIGQLNGLKKKQNKSQLYNTCKRFISASRKHRLGGKNYSMDVTSECVCVYVHIYNIYINKFSGLLNFN